MAHGVMRETARRCGEVASLASCALNVLIGTGDREITLSAGSWHIRSSAGARGARWYGRALVFIIDALNRPFDGPNHCERAWRDHAPIWQKVSAER